MSASINVDSLMLAAFHSAREPRSEQYRMGARAILEFLIESKPVYFPFAIGTTEADAFFAGEDEGRDIWLNAVRLRTDSRGDAA